MAATNHDQQNNNLPIRCGRRLVLDCAPFVRMSFGSIFAGAVSMSQFCKDPACGAGDSIKPGANPGETPGMKQPLRISPRTWAGENLFSTRRPAECSVFRRVRPLRTVIFPHSVPGAHATGFTLRPGSQAMAELFLKVRISVCSILLIACASVFFNSYAQRRVATTTSIPSPQSVLGFNPGDDRTIADWKQIRDYFTRLDSASDRVQVQSIGTSTLGRTMIAAFISAPENIRTLEKYKSIQAKLADPRKVVSDSERDQLIRDGKTVVVISCSIHSTEIVASQMSMQLAYRLATGNDDDTLAILRNTILILIPSPNPDGVDIVANYYRKTLGTPSEGRDPPELYHYYAGHDDNRDWFMLDLRETKNLTRLLWKEWFPEIVYDVHQQGSNGSRFFVPPF